MALTVPLSPTLGPDIEAASARYKQRKVTDEAHFGIAAIARAATQAFERESSPGPSQQVVHQLCKSAIDVPAHVPRANAYQPDHRDGHDYETGDDASGWRCLRFVLSGPQRYRFSYRAGGSYKGPARGGPDPGPHGFEVAAEGDLDGDGKTSLFTMTGTVDPRTKLLRRNPTIFVSDELE